MYEAVIIGGGPAGLAATMYCVRKGMDILMVTATMGGKSVLGLNLPEMAEYHVLKAREQVHIFRGRVEYLGHVWRRGRVARVTEEDGVFHLTLTDVAGSEEIHAERLIVATGTTPRPLGVPGEQEFFGRALGSSAVSYSHLLRERTVAVIGDSDRAVEAALECATQAEHVILILEPGAAYFPDHLSLLEHRENVAIYNGYRVLEIEGDTFARSVTISKEADAEDDRTSIGADAFFVEREPQRNSAIVSHLVVHTESGEIHIDAQNRTSNSRIFAAGDVTTVGIEQILVALGEGARAGLSAYRHFSMRR